MCPTIQVWNLHNMSEMIQYAKDLQIVSLVDFGHIHRDPDYLSIGVFPDQMIEDIIQENSKKVREIKTSYKFEHTYDDMVLVLREQQNFYNSKYDKKQLFDKTKRMAKWFDQSRKLNIYDHISTHKQLEDYYK